MNYFKNGTVKACECNEKAMYTVYDGEGNEIKTVSSLQLAVDMADTVEGSVFCARTGIMVIDW